MTSIENKKGHKKTKLGWIPEEWEVMPLRELISFLETGVSVGGENRLAKKGEIRVLKVSSVSYGIFNPKETKVVAKENVSRLKIKPKKGSILISRANTPDLVGATAFVYESCNNIYLPDKIWQTIFNSKVEVDSLYVFFSLQDERKKYTISNLATGSSGSMKNISKPSFLSINIPFPPLPEQEKIATILSTWDKAIDTITALIAAKEEQKKGLMQRLLTGKVRLSGPAQNWEWRQLSNFLRESKVPSKTNDPDKRITVKLKCKGVYKREFRGTEKKGATSFFVREKGQFIYGKQNFHKGAFGIIPDELDGFESSTDLPAFDFVSEDLVKDWFMYFVSRDSFYERLESLTTGTGSKRIKPRDFLSLKVKLPNKDKQLEVAAILNSASLEISNLNLLKNNIVEQRKGLMQQLLTGRTRVKI